MVKQSINLLEKLPNMENGVVIFILAVTSVPLKRDDLNISY